MFAFRVLKFNALLNMLFILRFNLTHESVHGLYIGGALLMEVGVGDGFLVVIAFPPKYCVRSGEATNANIILV
jgi:hypothetical protein